MIFVRIPIKEIKNKFNSLLIIKTEKYRQRKELGNMHNVIILGCNLSFIRATEIGGAKIEEKYLVQNSLGLFLSLISFINFDIYFRILFYLKFL